MFLSYTEAYRLTLERIQPLPSELLDLSGLQGRVTAENLYSKVDSPSTDVSFKDGYAVRSMDVAQACPEKPVALPLSGFVAAGSDHHSALIPGTAVRILSGAPLPQGADAVVSEEYAEVQGDEILLTRDASPGRNVLRKGSDVACGQHLLSAGMPIQPAQLGLAASGGLARIQVIQQPKVAILSTGDEVIAPGMHFQAGKIFASNLVTLAAWCSHFGMQVTTQVQPDDPDRIEASLRQCISTHDAVITSGGAWSGDRDLVIRVLVELGWTEVYHRVKMGPGKAVGFGFLMGKPVFCLPGGPPSNYMAFINLALPGLMKLAGYRNPGLPELTVLLGGEVRGQIDWTQFVHGRFEQANGSTQFMPLASSERLKMMAAAEAILTIPEGEDYIPAGSLVRVKVLGMPQPSIPAAQEGGLSS